ncbi:MAG: EAL domain-containing protein [Acidimicrobiales bacterium]
MFKAEHQHDVVARHRTEQALHKAIIEDELVVHYQPLIEIKTGHMIGAEARLRWERSGHGLLSPGTFIPVAEESELIVPMGEWVIDQVCEDMARWCEDMARWPKSKGRSPLVSINLAARHYPTAIGTLSLDVRESDHGHRVVGPRSDPVRVLRRCRRDRRLVCPSTRVR